MSSRLTKPAGLIITAMLSLAVLSVFYGNLFNKLNRVCFANGGDGMQSYINMDYHIRVDTAYMRCNSMNYPYGEHVFFTNNQPLISNTIKFISQNIIDISDYTLGILNFTMLFCLVIAPLILYLILYHHQQFLAIRVAPLFFRIGEMRTDIAQPGRSYHRVYYRVQCHISIAVSEEPSLPRHLHTAEHQAASLDSAVNIRTYSHPVFVFDTRHRMPFVLGTSEPITSIAIAIAWPIALNIASAMWWLLLP